jgi:hypothetical protein
MKHIKLQKIFGILVTGGAITVLRHIQMYVMYRYTYLLHGAESSLRS